MELVTTIREVREQVRRVRAAGLAIGLVPTMGYLHEGHASLVRRAAAAGGLVIVSIFVNPRQFGPGEDLDRYPRDLSGDLATCAAAGAGLVFAPSPAEMYPAGFSTAVEVAGLGDALCGGVRPGHFAGVATVVSKLFNIARPDRAYFGQKDYQQSLIIRRLAADLDFGVEVVVGPTVRDADGLALSSRNSYLSPAERRAAAVLPQALETARAEIAAGQRDGRELADRVRAVIGREPLATIDYVAVVDAATLEPLDRLAGTVLVALAVHFGGTRLIDNALIDVPA